MYRSKILCNFVVQFLACRSTTSRSSRRRSPRPSCRTSSSTTSSFRDGLQINETMTRAEPSSWGESIKKCYRTCYKPGNHSIGISVSTQVYFQTAHKLRGLRAFGDTVWALSKTPRSPISSSSSSLSSQFFPLLSKSQCLLPTPAGVR